MHIVFLIYTLILSTLIPQSVVANEKKWQTHESIMSLVSEFILHERDERFEVSVEVKRLDRRLKLADCNQDLKAFWPPGAVKSGNATVGVSCESKKPWKIYVQAKVSMIQEVAVLARAVIRGEALDQSMIRFEKRDVSKNREYFVGNIDNFKQYRFKRPYRVGKTITVSMLETPLLITRGDIVTITSSSSTLLVRMKGKALDDGTKGGIIRVRNLNSNRVVEGEVVRKGRVRIHN